MSLVSLPIGAVPDAQQAIISIWFRVPQASIDQATQESIAWFNNQSAPRPPMLGVVPIMTFGPPSKQNNLNSGTATVGTAPKSANWFWTDGFGWPGCVGAMWKMIAGTLVPGGPFPATRYTAGSLQDVDPSYIGVDCNGVQPALSVHIVMSRDDQPGEAVSSWSPQTSYTNTAAGIPNMGGGGICPGAPATYPNPPYGLQMYTVSPPPPGYSSRWTETYNYGDAGPSHNLLLFRAEMFRLLPYVNTGDGVIGTPLDNADGNYAGQFVAADTWHHLLLSFDFTNECSTTGGHTFEVRHTDPISHLTIFDSQSGSVATRETIGSHTTNACQMWVMLDGNNLTGADLSCYWSGQGDNDILTVNGFFVGTDNNFDVSSREYDIRGTDITVAQEYSTPSYSYRPEPVPLSQGPLGLPTAADYVPAIKQCEMAELQIFLNRTLETSDGEAVSRFLNEFGQPVPPDDPVNGSIAAFGEPDVLLHGNTNWQLGKNLGAAGPFLPVGTINKYKPEPTLGS